MDAPQIGLLNEKPLHAALKEWVAQQGDQFEQPVAGYVIDIVRGDTLIEIQTGNFTAIKKKLRQLLPDYPIQLVYPIAQEKWLIKLPTEAGQQSTRRKSPKKGSVFDLFRELVRLSPDICLHPHFVLDVVLIQEEETRRYDGKRAWRRKGWVTDERRLLNVLQTHSFVTANDYLTLLPQTMPDQFTTAVLAAELDQPRWLMQKMAYCLRQMKLIQPIGKQGRAILYERAKK